MTLAFSFGIDTKVESNFVHVLTFDQYKASDGLFVTAGFKLVEIVWAEGGMQSNLEINFINFEFDD